MRNTSRESVAASGAELDAMPVLDGAHVRERAFSDVHGARRSLDDGALGHAPCLRDRRHIARRREAYVASVT
jgi:hypothetical protein